MSDNRNESRETVADIVKELRRQSNSESKLATQLQKTDDDVDFALASCYAEDAKYISKIADRIEAAWKREREAVEADALSVGGVVEDARTTEKSSGVGNAAAMCEALTKISESGTYALKYRHEGLDYGDLQGFIEEMVEDARAALSAPARNCDLFDNWYDAHQAWERLPKDELGYFVAENGVHECEQAWLFAPAAERKGE